MGLPGFEWSRDTDQATWLGRWLEPLDTGGVASVVPTGFDAYARLLHPAASEGGRPVRWAEVSAWSGITLGRGTQFHEIALPRHAPPTPAPWDGGAPPAEGTLSADDAMTLVEVLRAHTSTPEACWFCVWDGFGWDGQPRDPVPPEVWAGPRVRLPHREYLLYAGPVEAALALLPEQDQTPNIWWPHDRAWCVATEIDLTESYLAGSQGLIEQLLHDPRLEALAAGPGDTMAFRLRGWQADAVEAGVAELLASGRTTITTSRGTLHAVLWRPTPSRSGQLSITRRTAQGDGGTSSSWFDDPDGQALRRHAWHDLGFALAELAAG